MGFIDFKRKLQSNFAELTDGVSYLFEVDIDKDELWELYLDSFPEGTNEIFRERTEHDCSCCRQFIKSFGGVVVIIDNTMKSIWDFTTDDTTYQPVIDALNRYVLSKHIRDVYISKEKNIGTDCNREILEDNSIIKWDHFSLVLPNKFVTKSHKSEAELKGDYKMTKQVFKRSLEELSLESILTVLELIFQGSLYRGDERKTQLSEFLKHKNTYMFLSDDAKRDNYAWEKSLEVGHVIGKIRNHSIGTLLINITEGMELDLAVKKYESIVAPTNYKRPKPLFTKRMLENAKNKIEELGYTSSLGRRFANINDITVNNILFVDRNTKALASKDIFGELEKDIVINPKRFSKVEEISIQAFIDNVLPTTNSLEVLFENKHTTNLVSLIAPKESSKSMFKWDNNFSWAYAGNIADSDMKQNVKKAGGKVDGVLRFSIQWNDDKSNYNGDDLDAYCKEPNGNVIAYFKKINISTSGELDVDIQSPREGVPAVENITWSDKNKMQEGTYQFYVNNYHSRGGNAGFKAEIEFDGELYTFEYPHGLRQSENIFVADVTYKNGIFKLTERLPASSSSLSKEIWGINTNQFVPVSILMHSPNHWDGNNTANQHYFFMLQNCINEECPNGFYNEFLKQELLEHKKVFAALGNKMTVEPTDNQLSGIGFSTTKRNDLLVKVKGQTERVLKVKF